MGKILVVEDDRDMRKQICKFLVKEKHEIFEAENGKIGLETAVKLKPDLILSDVMMPEMDGFALLEQIRKEPATRLIPFIILTVKGREEDVLKGLRLGGQDYVTKPFNFDILLARINVQLDLLNYRRRLEAEKQEYFETIAMRNDHLKLKSHLINQITHDIKNQLSPVGGYADLILTNLSTLKLEEEKEKPIRKYADTIKKHSERIEQQLQDLLNDIKQEGKKRLLNLETLAGDVVCFNYDNAKLKHQEIEFESQKDLLVQGLKYDLISAMDNLIGNAMKYSPKNTKIRVSVEKDADFVYFKVRDRGPGLTEEQIEKFKTDPANVGNKPTGGETPNGIGARTIITVSENHGGELIIKSEPGNGAAFIMKLPAA